MRLDASICVEFFEELLIRNHFDVCFTGLLHKCLRFFAEQTTSKTTLFSAACSVAMRIMYKSSGGISIIYDIVIRNP